MTSLTSTNPWDQREPEQFGGALPPDVRKIVDDFLNDPKRKAEIHQAADAAMHAFSRAKAVGYFVALAEIEDREMRMAFAKALQEAQALGRKASTG